MKISICSNIHFIILLYIANAFSQSLVPESVDFVDERDNYIFNENFENDSSEIFPERPDPPVLYQIQHDDNSSSSAIVIPMAEVFITKGNTEDTIQLSSEVLREIVITEDMVRNGSQFNHVVLLCNASYPVEWIYEGIGAPRLYTTQIRTYGDFFNPKTYGHSNIVVLVQERMDEQQTGSYICQGVDYPNLRTSFYLYFKGEFGFPSLQNMVIQPKENDTTVVLPCPTSDPMAYVSLYKVAPPEDSRNLTSHTSFVFDPKQGFLLNLADIPSPFGSYICKFQDMESLWKINLVPPKNQEVRILPNADVVQMDTLAEHNFMCKAKEPVQITLPNTVDFGTIEYSYNATEKFSYLAVLTLTPNIPLYSVANYFKVNCLSRKTRRVLHSWEYSNFGKDEIRVKYDKEQKRLLCCTKSGLNPIHEFAKCETITDCNIKKNCFNSGRCDYAFPPKFVDAPRGCTAVEFIDDFPSHVVKCSVGQFSRSMLITSNVDNDDLIIYDGTVPETEKILKITTVGQADDNHVNVRCVASIFFFSTNIVFAYEANDGSLRFAEEYLIENINSYGPILHATLESDVRRIICFAPLTRSTDWRNVSLDVVNKDESNTPVTELPNTDDEEQFGSDRVVTSVRASTSIATYLRSKRGHLVKVIQDV